MEIYQYVFKKILMCGGGEMTQRFKNTWLFLQRTKFGIELLYQAVHNIHETVLQGLGCPLLDMDTQAHALTQNKSQKKTSKYILKYICNF